MTNLEKLARETAEQLRVDMLAALRQAVEMFNRDIDHWHDLYKEEQAKIAVRDELLRDMAEALNAIHTDDPCEACDKKDDVLARYEALIKEDK